MSKKTAELKPSLIRTLIPFLVGPLAGWLANKGLDVDSVLLQMALSSVFGFLYYAGVRFLEVYSSSKWGYILGIAKSPAYSKADPPQEAPKVVSTKPARDATGRFRRR